MNQEIERVEMVFEDVENKLGYKTTLKQSTWDYHITGGHNSRSELVGQENIVIKTLQEPSYVTKGEVSGTTRYNFIRSAKFSDIDRIFHLKVVTESTIPGYHDIVTTVPQKDLKIRDGEEIVYDFND